MEFFPQRTVDSDPGGDGCPELSTVTSRLWYRAVLSDARIGRHQVPMLSNHFAEALGAAGWPDGACLFVIGGQADGATPDEDGFTAPAALFFSPSAIAAVPHLIVVCGAEPSPPPARACATLLVGKESDWELLPHGLQ